MKIEATHEEIEETLRRMHNVPYLKLIITASPISAYPVNTQDPVKVENANKIFWSKVKSIRAMDTHNKIAKIKVLRDWLADNYGARHDKGGLFAAKMTIEISEFRLNEHIERCKGYPTLEGMPVS